MKIVSYILVCVLLSSCFPSAGTLGAGEKILLKSSKEESLKLIDSTIKKYPKYKTPDKYMKYDNWKTNGYDFLVGRVLYFPDLNKLCFFSFYEQKNVDEENSSISVRAGFDFSTQKWVFASEMSSKELNDLDNALKHFVSLMGLVASIN